MIEDAAQAVGATWNGKRAGSLGLAAAFSFYPTKNLSAFGDAGAVTTSDARLAERMRSLRNHGGKQRYYHDEVGRQQPAGFHSGSRAAREDAASGQVE